MSMESSFLRKFEKNEKDKKAALEPKKEPEVQQVRPDIPEIRKDKVLSKQFGGFLQAHDDVAIREMGMRMIAGNLEESDVIGLQKKREDFFDQKAQSERLSEALRGERFEQMLEFSPALQNLCKAYGKENIQELLQSGAAELPFLDQKGFKDLYGVLKDIETFERDVEGPLQQNMSVLCKQFKLSEDEVVKAMESKSPLERRAALENAIRDNMSGWAIKMPKWLPAKWSGQVVGWGEKAKDSRMTQMQRHSEYGIQAMIFARDHDEWKDAIEMRANVLEKQGNFMASFVSKNKDVRQALGRVINGERPYFKEVVDNTATYDEARGLLLTEKTVKKAVDQYKSLDANKNINFENLSAADLDTHMGKVYDEAKNNAQREAGKKIGFWMKLVNILFGNPQERANFIQNPAMRKTLAA
jgi:hypothetical protein